MDGEDFHSDNIICCDEQIKIICDSFVTPVWD